MEASVLLQALHLQEPHRLQRVLRRDLLRHGRLLCRRLGLRPLLEDLPPEGLLRPPLRVLVRLHRQAPSTNIPA